MRSQDSGRPLSLPGLLISISLALSGCESLEWQALRLYLAANPHLDVVDGPRPYRAATEDLWLVPITDELEFPWGLAFINENEVLVTEKPGRLSRIDLRNGAVHPIAGVPEVAFVGQGGLLGVALDPNFSTNRWLYLTYSIAVPPDAYTTRVSRARLRDDELGALHVLLTAEPAVDGINHFGGALAFDADGLLYISVGERKQRRYAQDLDSHLGKILRIRPDGSVPDDNPFVGRAGARPRIFSWGHRNPQGLARHPTTGEMWSSEHGPKGGDEINIVRAGRNYGWPIISHGDEYTGGPVGVGTHRKGLEQSIHFYVPSIATGGIGFYTGDQLPSWRGDLFVAGLRLTHLNRLALDGERVVQEERLFTELWHRVRAVAESPFTHELFVLTENGTLFRLDPRAEALSGPIRRTASAGDSAARAARSAAAKPVRDRLP